MIITEYCEFGNLRCFLQAHRQYFIDQIVRDKDLIDPTISLRYVLALQKDFTSIFNVSFNFAVFFFYSFFIISQTEGRERVMWPWIIRGIASVVQTQITLLAVARITVWPRITAVLRTHHVHRQTVSS